MHRRQFLHQLGAGATGLAIGSHLYGCSAPADETPARALAQTSTRNASLSLPADPRMDWWREARFGMFIHYGLYSTLGGEWKGKRAGSHEWIRSNHKIPHEEYVQLADEFNPAAFNADEWISAARNAGQKYVVFTTKHHEGFSMFDSRATTYDVMSTPFKRDIVREVADSCRRHDMRIGWYYSIMDWYHADYLPRRDWEKRSSNGADFTRYIAFMKEQLRELLTQYGDISVLWFDGQWESTWNHAQGQSLYDYCRSIAPQVIINDRVDAGLPKDENIRIDSGTLESAVSARARRAGDFTTPEQKVPATGLPGVDWESCITMNDNWGYSRFDHNYKSVDQLISLLVDTASKGGNLLLNVGPMGDGRIPKESTDALRSVGAWMRVNGNAIYASHATPFANAPVRVTAQDKRLNLFVESWKGGSTLLLPGLRTAPLRAYLNADEAVSIATAATSKGVEVKLPDRASGTRCPVVVLDFDREPVVG